MRPIILVLVDAIRSLVRPVALFLIMGGFVGFLANGDLEAAQLTAAFGGPVLGYWFAERKSNGGSQ